VSTKSTSTRAGRAAWHGLGIGIGIGIGIRALVFIPMVLVAVAPFFQKRAVFLRVSEDLRLRGEYNYPLVCRAAKQCATASAKPQSTIHNTLDIPLWSKPPTIQAMIMFQTFFLLFICPPVELPLQLADMTPQPESRSCATG
jgi:hypothetical protein